MKTLDINKNDAGQRLDKFLTKAVKALPLALVYKYIRLKKIKVNGKRAEISYRLNEGDKVELYIKDEFFEPSAADNAYKILTPKIDVVYEDSEIIICDKRPGMLSHSGGGEEINTLIGHIKAYLYQKGEYDPDNENSFAPALCHRLDRNTGGLVIAAKTAAALRRVNSEIKESNVVKKYLCAVHGTLEKKESVLTGYLLKDEETNTVTVYNKRPLSENVKTIVTEYKVIAENGGLSLLDVALITGRTHQIRAHFASAGHPLLGDGKYGVNRNDKKAGYKYQALYSYYLKLDGREYYADKSKIWFLKEFQ